MWTPKFTWFILSLLAVAHLSASSPFHNQALCHWTDLVRNLILLMSLNCTNEPSSTYQRSSNGNNCNSISLRVGHSLWLICPMKNSGKLIQERKHKIQPNRTSNQSKLSPLKCEGEVHVIQKMKYFSTDSALTLSFFRVSHQNYEVWAHHKASLSTS